MVCVYVYINTLYYYYTRYTKRTYELMYVVVLAGFSFLFFSFENRYKNENDDPPRRARARRDTRKTF